MPTAVSATLGLVAIFLPGSESGPAHLGSPPCYVGGGGGQAIHLSARRTYNSVNCRAQTAGPQLQRSDSEPAGRGRAASHPNPLSCGRGRSRGPARGPAIAVRQPAPPPAKGVGGGAAEAASPHTSRRLPRLERITDLAARGGQRRAAGVDPADPSVCQYSSQRPYHDLGRYGGAPTAAGWGEDCWTGPTISPPPGSAPSHCSDTPT